MQSSAWKNYVDIQKAKRILLESESLIGGESDNITLESIANKHNISLEEITKQFYTGVEVESEHTSDPKIAEEIAKDHLMENPSYYTVLKQVGLEENTHYDQSANIVDQYADMDPNEAISELSQDKKELESQLAKLNAVIATQKSHWNMAWHNLLKTGKNSKGATNSVSLNYSPIRPKQNGQTAFDDAIEIYKSDTDAKLSTLGKRLAELYFQEINKINSKLEEVRRGPNQQKLDPVLQGNVGTSKMKDVRGQDSTILARNDILTSSIFGNYDKQAIELLKQSVKNDTIDSNSVKQIGRLMNGPSGKFLKFMFLNDENMHSDPLVKMFLGILDNVKNSDKLTSQIAARTKAISTLSPRTQKNSLYEGLKNWHAYRKLNENNEKKWKIGDINIVPAINRDRISHGSPAIRFYLRKDRQPVSVVNWDRDGTIPVTFTDIQDFFSTNARVTNPQTKAAEQKVWSEIEEYMDEHDNSNVRGTNWHMQDGGFTPSINLE